MARATAAAAARTAQQVLAAASELFGDRGYAGVSLGDVARRARVTRGAVYHHFGDKAGLFSAVATALQTQVATAVVSAAEGAGAAPTHQLIAGSHAFLDAITTGSAARILLVDGPAVIGWEQWRRLDSENSAAHLREALAAVGVNEELLDATTALLSGAMNEAALWIAQNPTEPVRSQAHRVLDQLLQTFLPDP
ncbi:TetR/AcrR family transcriptional regulator [Parenemella sanctibonifatiensis]|uniref:TetR family transcriptional regulator n=1 Tax=Parenemella sanctibonifatiensis TaxID=2016505 RepID=A0A255E9P9_9ACTN|nr:TetR/AcrR family transcriptional regulator [Parenemella sanctibonifatiensis]OYN87641.1 TetR family transcriptional regulator [Parenemella sanctibonifatiensis]